MKKVYIMSGVSGSGKSTAVKALASAHANAVVVSADNYFGKDSETYKKNFSPAKLGEAHNRCKRAFLKALELDTRLCSSSEEDEEIEQWLSTVVIVDNTNTSAIEMAMYIETALAYNCEVIIVRVLADVETCISRNTHGVPEHAIRAMHERFSKNTVENWPYHWQDLEVRTIDNRASK